MSDEEIKMDISDTAQSKSSNDGTKQSVYLPERELRDDEVLEFDPSAYHMMHEAYTESPCMSFDIIPDDLGDNRQTYPHVVYLVAGTQAVRKSDNKIIIMKWSNLRKTYKPECVGDDEEESSDSSSSDDDNERKLDPKSPVMSSSSISHFGCLNRIRTTVYNNTVLAAVWSETKVVSIFDLKKHLKAVEYSSKTQIYSSKKRKFSSTNEKEPPLFSFSGYLSEGFALDWCPTVPGMLATGDCINNIHIWSPHESTWNVDLRSLKGHTNSVEDVQWSPKESSILASCSVDKSIRIWDIRVSPSKACMLTVEDAHTKDVNVIHWNKMEPLIISGGDDGCINIWDIRNFKKDAAIATFKYHSSGVTSIEWHPKDSSVFASSDNNQIALWDLAVERDTEDNANELEEIPPQLLFMHLGQEYVKEIHWHSQIPGVLISTAQNNFNIFQTISV